MCFFDMEEYVSEGLSPTLLLVELVQQMLFRN